MWKSGQNVIAGLPWRPEPSRSSGTPTDPQDSRKPASLQKCPDIGPWYPLRGVLEVKICPKGYCWAAQAPPDPQGSTETPSDP